MSKEWNPRDIFDVLASEHARKILAAASVRPVSAQELEAVCGTSLPTVYRRVNALCEYDLLSDQLHVEADGTQYSTYTSDLKGIQIRVENGGFDVNIEIRKDSVDQFGELISDLETGGTSAEPTEYDDSSGFDSGASGSGG